MNELTGAIWRTSSRSNDQGLCVEVADNLVDVLGVVGVRDSKDPTGPTLSVGPTEWTAFVGGLRAGGFRR
ncbi:DUF397 domain-containing protein [Micromonospora rosaria]|uniref:DUF397 domain-containing protein n=1 Tax=Micromonospora rosaria TaxID=47874 RepID=A0A136PKC7_9ACTN|nr:DUF397 domain-containing protein [Micromonospora rosaria]KXK58882.1 DUF397 domain-containing protein [Micromonospora rosaria]